MKVPTSVQKKNFAIGLNCDDLICDVWATGITIRTSKLANNAITPINLSGIDLKIV
jgi:hypothetical protein